MSDDFGDIYEYGPMSVEAIDVQIRELEIMVRNMRVFVQSAEKQLNELRALRAQIREDGPPV